MYHQQKESFISEYHMKLQWSLKWLKADSGRRVYHEAYSAMRSEYLATCQWVLKNKVLDRWRKANIPDKSIIWINGMPGAGKLFRTKIALLILI